MDEVAGLTTHADGQTGCWWTGDDAQYREYHDTEWGRPVADDTRLFEKLCLEGFQAGLSWLTILRKRENFRSAFAGFDPETVAAFDDADVDRLLGDAGIVRHRGKITAVINNAQRYRELCEEFGSLAAYVWSYEPDTENRPAVLDYDAAMTLASTPESTAMSRDLKKRGWRFVGPTTAYAFMQSMGVVNDHIEGCAMRAEVASDRSSFSRPCNKGV